MIYTCHHLGGVQVPAVAVVQVNLSDVIGRELRLGDVICLN